MNIISFSWWIPVAMALLFDVGVSSTPALKYRPGCPNAPPCDISPCKFAKCEPHPDAYCVPNFCSCNATFYDKNWKEVDCKDDSVSTTTTTIVSTTTDPNATTPPPGACGIKPAAIVGGSAATPYSIPWQVGLVYSGGDSPFCGGTLISPLHVLTAAHCMFTTNFDVIVGEHHITSSSDGTRHQQCRGVKHPDYNSDFADFAIVHLRQPVQIGTRAAPACLPSANLGGDFLDGKMMTVSGWGNLASGGISPSVLHKVDVPGITNAVCSNSYSGITSSMLCAGDVLNGGIDSCQGDSGGPMTYNVAGRATVVGVVSWGIGCAQAGYPGVYSRVTEALNWINGEMATGC